MATIQRNDSAHPSPGAPAGSSSEPAVIATMVRALASKAHRALAQSEGGPQTIDELLRQIRDLRSLVPRSSMHERELSDLDRWIENLCHQAEQKRDEVMLRQVTALYESLAENLPQSLVRKDREGRYTFANRCFCTWMGRPLEAILGKTDFDFFPTPLAQQFRRDDRWVFKKGRTFERVEQLPWLDGTTRWVKVIKARIEDGHGHYLGMHALFEDVTEQERTERCGAVQLEVTRVLAQAATLREATPRILQVIGEQLGWEHGALWRVDHAAQALRCVATWCSPWVDLEEFEAQSWRLTFASGVGMPGRAWASGQPVWVGDVAREVNFLRATIAARSGFRTAFAFPILLEPQVLGVIEFFGRQDRPTPDDDLMATMAVLGSQIGQYIERKRAEDEYKRLFELSLDMFCVAGFDGYFKLLNPAWERTLGFSRAELTAKPYREFIHPEDRAATQDTVQKLINGSNAEAFENRYRCRDGTYRWLLWNAVPLPEEQMIYAVARDMTAERKRQDEDRAIRKIQQALFPHAAPPLEGIDIAGASSPVGAAGGDYFDYIPMSDEAIGVVIGDVCGHGLASALLMTSTRATLRGHARSGADVGEILTLANRALVDDFGERFASLLLARLDPRTRSLTYTNAGHPPGYVLDAAGQIKATLESTGGLLGIDADADYLTGAAIALEPGDLVLMMTDGLLEATAPDDTMFGPHRALDAAGAHRDRPAGAIVDAIFAAVRDFGRGTPQCDDITAVVIKVGPVPRP